PGHEHAPPAEQVSRAAAEQQEAAERDHVRVDHPGKVRLGEVEPLADAGQGDVDDRRVEDDDELGHAEQDEGGPAAVQIFLSGCHFPWLLSCPVRLLHSYDERRWRESTACDTIYVEPEFRFRLGLYGIAVPFVK